MARIRNVKPSFFTSEDVCRCTPLARLLFLGLWCEADKLGRVVDKPLQLKLRILPADDCDVDTLLWELHDRGLVRRMAGADGGPDYVQVVTFGVHQRPHPKEPESTIPTSKRERSRSAVEKHGAPCMVPGDVPSCPVGREGKGTDPDQDQDQGGDRTAAPPARRVSVVDRAGALGLVSPGAWQRQHATHALRDLCCDWVCLPQVVYDEWLRRLTAAGTPAEQAALDIRAWVSDVKARWHASGDVPGDSIFDFWRHEWQRTWGSNRTPSAPKPGAGLDVLIGGGRV